MRLSGKLLAAAFAMLALAVLFVVYAVFIAGPTAALPISFAATMLVYKGYLAVMVLAFVVALALRLRNK